jgi:hypothetical protein
VFPLRRFAHRTWLYSVRHRTEPASHGVASPFRVFVRKSLAPVSVGCSPHALGRSWATGSSQLPAPGSLRKKTRESSHGLVLSFRVHQARAAARAFHPRGGLGPRGSSHEVSSPSASPRPGQRHRWPGLPRPTASAFRFSQPPDALIRPEPAGLVSCRIRSWGCALQSLAPLVQPYAVSGASTLLSFERTRRPPRPSEPAGRSRRIRSG